MKIILNGEKTRTDVTNLGELCAPFKTGDTKIATALNGRFIAASKRFDTPLAENDRIEVVAPRQGG